MKTMKKMNVNELKSLSRTEMKNIMAGSGTCCVTVVGNVSTSRVCGMSSAEAQAEANTVASWGGVRAFWCCASC